MQGEAWHRKNEQSEGGLDLLPFIIGGAAALVAAGVAAYKYFDSEPASSPPRAEPPISVGRFAIWGQPNVGKTTFISKLLKKPYNPTAKEATTFKTTHTEIPVVRLGGQSYKIQQIADLPGTKDRLNDWLELVSTHEHVFYLIDISRHEPDYKAAVRSDLKATVQALVESRKQKKRLNIIATHIDESTFCDVDKAEVNNVLQKDPDFCRLYESTEGVSGYVYSANLMSDDSFQRLLESIIKDGRA